MLKFIPGKCDWYISWQKALCTCDKVIGGLMKRLLPTYNLKFAYERERESHEEIKQEWVKADMATGAGKEGMWCKDMSQEWKKAPETWKGKNRFSQRIWETNRVLQTHTRFQHSDTHFWILVSRTVRGCVNRLDVLSTQIHFGDTQITTCSLPNPLSEISCPASLGWHIRTMENFKVSSLILAETLTKLNVW